MTRPQPARKKSRSGPSGPSGQHVTPRRRIPAPPKQAKLWDRAAELSGCSWPEWALSALTVMAAEELGLDPLAALEERV